jgi:hypothetical protein
MVVAADVPQSALVAVTTSPQVLPGWTVRKIARKINFIKSNLPAIRRLLPKNPLGPNGEKDMRLVQQQTRKPGWIAPLLTTYNRRRRRPPTIAIWDKWASAHWKFEDYRNRIGVFADVYSVAEFFRPFHKCPLDYAERKEDWYKDMIQQGRTNLINDIVFARRHQPEIMEKSDVTLAELKRKRLVRKFFVRVLRCRSPAALKKITDYTLAFIVQFIRDDYRCGKYIHQKVAEFAPTGFVAYQHIEEQQQEEEDASNML